MDGEARYEGPPGGDDANEHAAGGRMHVAGETTAVLALQVGDGRGALVQLDVTRVAPLRVRRGVRVPADVHLGGTQQQ